MGISNKNKAIPLGEWSFFIPSFWQGNFSEFYYHYPLQKNFVCVTLTRLFYSTTLGY